MRERETEREREREKAPTLNERPKTAALAMRERGGLLLSLSRSNVKLF
jgi:hypothetical protein